MPGLRQGLSLSARSNCASKPVSILFFNDQSDTSGDEELTFVNVDLCYGLPSGFVYGYGVDVYFGCGYGRQIGP